MITWIEHFYCFSRSSRYLLAVNFHEIYWRSTTHTFTVVSV